MTLPDISIDLSSSNPTSTLRMNSAALGNLAAVLVAGVRGLDCDYPPPETDSRQSRSIWRIVSIG